MGRFRYCPHSSKGYKYVGRLGCSGLIITRASTPSFQVGDLGVKSLAQSGLLLLCFWSSHPSVAGMQTSNILELVNSLAEIQSVVLLESTHSFPSMCMILSSLVLLVSVARVRDATKFFLVLCHGKTYSTECTRKKDQIHQWPVVLVSTMLLAATISPAIHYTARVINLRGLS